MQYNTGEGSRSAQAASGKPDQFQFDLTEEQRRLCDWVARQARIGTRQIRYQEATAALAIREEQLTRMLQGMRERLDEIHAMVEAPVVNTWTPYFEVPAHARHIWDSYRQAETSGGPAEAQSASDNRCTAGDEGCVRELVRN